MPQSRIPFTKPDLTGDELEYVAACLESRSIAGDGAFTTRCRAILEAYYQAPVLLTHSCTAALEMAALLTVEAGDEVIMPSYTFVSTANAFVLRGAVPVFVDIRADTLNIDESAIEAAVGPRTRAIVPVHYAGVGCEMDAIMAIADRRELVVIEDAAQAYCAAWNDKPLGSFGALAALSFHQTKNVVSGEGGLLIVNDRSLLQRANIVREKGTNRTEFIRGEVDKYEWLDIGSSYLPSDLIAAVLLAQLKRAEQITSQRLALWSHYHERLAPLERKGMLRRPTIPAQARHNAHIYYVVFEDASYRARALEALQAAGITGSTHYVPLHSAPAGKRYGRVVGSMAVTDQVASAMLRLPLHGSLTERDVDRIVDVVTGVFSYAV